MFELKPHQKKAVENLKSGKILCGGVGTGKSLTALAFYFKNYSDHKLVIITTARKRDDCEWDTEFIKMGKTCEYIVDSWNNIEKYKNVTGAFFIFDEQRVVGNGKWSKTFITIAMRNQWILLTATPGDTWLDYVPVFIANGFYKNRTQFLTQHVVFDQYAKFPKVRCYINVDKLIMLEAIWLT